VLGLGTATFGREVSDQDGVRLVHAFTDRGFNLVDTADSYAGGAAEEIVGKALRGRRDQVVLATKAGLPLHPAPERSRGSRRHLTMALDASLRRLRTEHVDVFHLHRWDDQAPVEETLSTVDAMVRAGKVRYVAVSNFTGWQLAWCAVVSRQHGWEPVVAVQSRYSAGSRDAEREILPYCRWAGLGFVAFSPLSGGILTGKYQPGQPFPPGTRAADPAVGASLRRRLAAGPGSVAPRLRDLAASCGVTPAQLSLTWLLSRRGVSSAVVGVTGPAQLEENLSAATLAVDQAVLDDLDAVAAGPLGYPQALLAKLGCGDPEVPR
jgi:aryl-alcohol dehydrogenase-like predicted oxidoreductase